MGAAKEIGLKHAGWTGESAQSVRAFRAAQVVGGGGFDGDGKRVAPVNGSAVDKKKGYAHFMMKKPHHFM